MAHAARSLSAWDLGTQRLRASWRLTTSVRSVAVAPDQVGLGGGE